MDALKVAFLDQYRNQLSDIELPGRITERYVLTACLNSGKSRQTFLLEEKNGRKQVLAKQSPLSSPESLMAEYEMLAALNHPDIPRALDYFEEDGYAYLLREYFTGVTLYDIVERRGVLSEDIAVRALYAICDILSYLHRQTPPVIHRDIKPQNIILTPDGGYKLIDMGTCRHFRAEETKDTVFMGTELTAAPEQYGYRQTDERSDIYALGVLLIFLLTGSFSLEAQNLAVISLPLRRIVSRCIAFSPEKRYSSVKRLIFRLKSVQSRKSRLRRVAEVANAFLLGVAACFAVLYFGVMQSPFARVEIQSPLLEQAIREQLSILPGEPVRRLDLYGLTGLFVTGDTVFTKWDSHNQYMGSCDVDWVRVEAKGDIEDIGFLRYCKNLRELVLNKQSISDISALSGLPLVRLSLCDNQIYDISPLADCKRLNHLEISDNPLRSLSPIEGLSALSLVDVSYTNVDSITALSGNPIQQLLIGDLRIDDLTTLVNYPRLERLVATGVSAENQKIIAGIKSLRELTLYGSGITDVTPFSALRNLTSFDLHNNEVEDFSPITACNNLTFIGISENPVKSIESLSRLSNLQSLSIGNSPVEDLEALGKFQYLREVYCSKQQAEKIEEFFPHPSFSVRIQ